MAWVVYDKFKLDQMNQVNPINLGSDTIRCMLVTASYTPTVATDQYINTTGLNTNEVSAGSTYTAKGPTLPSQTCTLTPDTVTFTCSNIVISQDATGFTNARYAVLYKDTGVVGTSHLICYADLGGNKSIQGGSLTLQIDASGIFTLT